MPKSKEPLDINVLVEPHIEEQILAFLYFVQRTQQYKRRVPRDVQGVVIDGIRLTAAISLSLKNGMTRAQAIAYTEELVLKARAHINYRIADKDAWELAPARASRVAWAQATALAGSLAVGLYPVAAG